MRFESTTKQNLRP